ncbi:hypothetical protein [Brevibacillus borstelensis]|uniref:hypothetical protein n=1 Tax=Brevibacillus borstelensis TaxID=45462 RepID=UPI0030C2C1CF
MEQDQTMSRTEEAAEMQAEFPATGTPLNPVEEAWAFSSSAAAPADELARAMQQGE